MNTRKQIAIIGGGPSGMIAAITAARTGCQVTLFERQERIGRKILATGNGRCNLSNTSCGKDNFIGTTNDFVIPALTRFTVEQTLRFFHCLGIHCTVENDGKVFPLCGQASAVLDTLRAELSRLAVRVVVQSPVTALIPQKKGFLVKTAGSATQSPFSAESCIVTAGGKAMPNLGGTDSGLTLLKQLHHRLVPVYPGLVPLKSANRFNKHLKGTKTNAQVSLCINGSFTEKEYGEVLFTEYGLSGPPIIQLSNAVNFHVHQEQGSAPNIELFLDLFPNWSQERLCAILEERYQIRPDVTLESSFIGFLHKKLIPALLSASTIADAGIPVNTLTAAQRLAIAITLKKWRFPVSGSLSWNEAHVMGGGIATEDFDSSTLQSKLVPGLFVAGEILDITGDCGGHNLQWAWSSGYVCGMHAAGA